MADMYPSGRPGGHVLKTSVRDPVKELEGTKDMFVSYLAAAETDLPGFTSQTPSARRRFQDFVFLREHLTKDFPAAVVPPLPDKHRMEYFTGDRFSPEFIERRRVDLQRFLERLARHPKLSRTELFRAFMESTEWNVFKHKRGAHIQNQNSADPEAHPGLLDNLSDTLLNAFTKVRKPDERFVAMRLRLEQLEDSMTTIERLGSRGKTRLTDLSTDYEDMAMAVQGLGYLESGIVGPLTRFEQAILEYGQAIVQTSEATADPFVEHVHSLSSYSAQFRALLKLRDQKQLDFEDLSAYLSSVTSERDRLVGGYSYGIGIGSYLKDKVDALRGATTDASNEAKVQRLDVKIGELQDAVIQSQDMLQAFNKEVLQEEAVFNAAKRAEMKELFGEYCDGQIGLAKRCVGLWETAGKRLAE